MRKVVCSGIVVLIVSAVFLRVQSVKASVDFNPWNTISGVLTQGIANTSLIVIGNNLYVIGGSNINEVKDVYSFPLQINGSVGPRDDGSTNLPSGSGPYWSSAVNTNPNTIVKMGGLNYSDGTGSTNKVLLGTIDTLGHISSWSQVFSLPKALSLGDATVVGNYLYYLGGATWPEITFSDDIYVSYVNGDGTIDAWQSANINLPTPLAAQGTIVSGDKIYIIGGSTNDSFSGTSNVYVYQSDPTNGNLTRLSDEMSLPISSRSGMIARSGDFIVHAGGVVNGSVINNVYYTTIDGSGHLGPWIKSNQHLPTINCCTSMTSWGNYLYIVGGHDGGNYFNSVIYSSIGVAPTPTPTPTPTLTPIILIPGLGASWNHDLLVHTQPDVPDTDWRIAPYVKEYDGLISSLENAGYILNNNLFVYAYDWRNDVNQTADNLNDFIESKFNPGTKISLIGHSLGGLIGRIYTNSHPNRINNLYTLGSPHMGAVGTYKIWEGADFSDLKSWEKLAVDLYLRVTRGDFTNEVAQVRSVFPVFIDIWPNFDFLKNNTSMSFSNPIPLNFSPTLTKTLNGTDTSTNRYIKVSPRSALDAINNKWVDGVPVSYETDNGDGTVLKTSAQVPDAVLNQDFSGVLHRQLPSDSAVMQFLLTDLSLAGSLSEVNQPSLDKAILVTTASPVSFQVNTSNGIVDPQDGVVVIDNPSNGNYSVIVTPQGAGGDYTLYFGRFNGDDVAWDVIQNNVTTGQTDIQNFNINLDSASLGADPIKQINSHLDQIRNIILGTGLNFNYKLTVLARLLEIRLRVNSLPFINRQTLFDKQLTQIISDINSFPTIQNVQSIFNLIKPLLLQYRGDRFGN